MILLHFDRQKWEKPLWLVFPEVSPEMHPRPEAWITYADEWTEWYRSLPRDERRAYEEQFPEPDGWQDFYRFVSNEPPRE